MKFFSQNELKTIEPNLNATKLKFIKCYQNMNKNIKFSEYSIKTLKKDFSLNECVKY
jgi:hypothetical protein